MAVALALNAEHVIGRRIYRVLFVLPWALPGYITALIWNNLWQRNDGGINLLFESINKHFGTNLPTRTDWLGQLDPPVDLRSIVPCGGDHRLRAGGRTGWCGGRCGSA